MHQIVMKITETKHDVDIPAATFKQPGLARWCGRGDTADGTRGERPPLSALRLSHSPPPPTAILLLSHPGILAKISLGPLLG